jgi:hypothetical protein
MKTIGIAEVASFGRYCGSGTTASYDRVDVAADEIGGQCGQPIIMALGPAVLPHHVLAFDEAHFAHSLVDRAANQVAEICGRRESTEPTDHQHRLLLCMSANRPPNTYAAKKREEVPPFHSIVSEPQAAWWRCARRLEAARTMCNPA